MQKSRLIKKFILLFVICSFSFLCSCERYGTEIEDMMIIEGIAVDLNQGKYEVTIEMLNNKQSASADASNVGEEMTLTYSASGETIAEALRLLINKTGTVPTYAHNKVIILSEAVIRRDISKILDFFERDYTAQPTTLLCVAEGVKAGEILKADIGTDISKSEVLEKILNQSALSSVTPETRLIDVINAILDETTCVTIPTVKLKNDGDIKSFFVDSIAVFNYDNTFSYILGRKASESVVKLSGEIKNGTIVTEDEKGNKATFIIVDGKTKYNVRVENGVLIYDVKIKLYCDLNAYEGDNFKPIEKETVEIFKRNIESDVKRSVSETYGIILQYGSYDILRFGRRLLQSEKESYKFLKNDWQESFRNSQLNADIDIVIRRIGEESYN